MSIGSLPPHLRAQLRECRPLLEEVLKHFSAHRATPLPKWQPSPGNSEEYKHSAWIYQSGYLDGMQSVITFLSE